MVKVIFILNPLLWLFLEAFPFSSPQFVQGTPPKRRKKSIMFVPEIPKKTFWGSSWSSNRNFHGKEFPELSLLPISQTTKTTLKGSRASSQSQTGPAWMAAQPNNPIFLPQFPGFLRISKVPDKQGLGLGFEHFQQSLSSFFARFFSLYMEIKTQNYPEPALPRQFPLTQDIFPSPNCSVLSWNHSFPSQISSRNLGIIDKPR